MLLVYNKDTGEILAVASSINENGVKREPLKDEVFPHIEGEVLIMEDNDDIINHISNYIIENGGVEPIQKQPIKVTGIPATVNPGDVINLSVSLMGYDGPLKAAVTRGLLSSNEVFMSNGSGSISLTVPNETVTFGLSIFSLDDKTILPFQTMIEVVN